MSKFEIGSQWKTREGYKTVIVDIPERGGTFWAWHSGDGEVYEHRIVDGSYCHDDSPDSLDLIEPWREPVVHEGWISVLWNGKGGTQIQFGGLHNEPEPEINAIACIKIKFTEGEGL